jgi:hypothetical protein
MANRGLFTILIVFLGLGILFAGGMNTGYDNASTEYDVVNESITVDYSATVSVDESGESYSDTVDVYNDSGAELTDGTDYDWNATDGNVTWFNTSATVDGETATISYSYTAKSGQTTAMGTVIKVSGIGLTFIAFLLVGQWLFDVVGDW